MPGRLFSHRLAAGLLSGSLAAATLLPAGTAAAAETWSLATDLPEGSVQVQSLELFGQDLRTASSNRMSALVYPRETLALTQGLLNAVQSGAVQMAALPLSAMAGWGPLYEADSLPTLATDYPAARKLWKVLKDPLQRDLWQRDLILLFAAPQAPRGLVGGVGLGDGKSLAGLDVGTSNALASAMVQQLGATPSEAPGDLLAQALSDGRLDAAFLAAPAALKALGSGQAATFYPFRSWIPFTVVVMHEGTFESLSRADQEALRVTAAAAEAQAWAAGEGQNAALIRLLERDGLYQDAPALDTALQAAGRRVASDWLQRAGLQGEALLRAFRN
ncbi:MAG: TRAP transporter substrate-binding protein DctP [Pseudomonadota bacterium]